MSNPISPEELVEEIKKFDEKVPYDILHDSYNFFFGDLKDEIVLFETKAKRYTLQRSFNTLYHDNNDPGMGFLHLTDQRNVADTSSAQYLEAPAGMPTVFFSLGWIVEQNVSDINDRTNSQRPHKRRTTNYVLLWNVSTKPGSLWLVYDYQTASPYGDGFDYNKLEDYQNLLFADYEQEKGYVPAPNCYEQSNCVSPRIQTIWNVGGTRDLLLCSRDDNKADSKTKSGHCSVNHNGQSSSVGHDSQGAPLELGELSNGLGGIDVQAGEISSEKSDGSDDSTGTAKVQSLSPSNATGPPMFSSTDCDADRSASNNNDHSRHSFFDTKGSTHSNDGCNTTTVPNFLGSPEKFDLAMIALNIQNWDPKKGLATNTFFSCLQANHYHVGDRLRAASIPEAKYKDCTKQRFNIDHYLK